MIYAVPPVPPAIVYVEVAPQAGTLIAEECERGSRDCFPKDRVGHGTEDGQVMALRPWSINDLQSDNS